MEPYVPGMTWSDYVRRTAGEDGQAAIAEKAGVDQSTVSRWIRGAGRVDPWKAAAFARAYKRPVLEAFIAAGFLSPEEAKARPAMPAYLDFSEISNDDLLELVRMRMREEGESGGDTAPTTPADVASANNVHTLTPDDQASSLRARARRILRSQAGSINLDLGAARPGTPDHAARNETGEESQDGEQG